MALEAAKPSEAFPWSAWMPLSQFFLIKDIENRTLVLHTCFTIEYCFLLNDCAGCILVVQKVCRKHKSKSKNVMEWHHRQMMTGEGWRGWLEMALHHLLNTCFFSMFSYHSNTGNTTYWKEGWTKLECGQEGHPERWIQNQAKHTLFPSFNISYRERAKHQMPKPAEDASKNISKFEQMPWRPATQGMV